MTIRDDAIKLYKPPFRYENGYICDSIDNMAFDCDDHVDEAMIARVRGWGRISYLPKARDLQDEVGAILVDALNLYYQIYAKD